MKELLIGDMHFGVKTNSVYWLEMQLEFIDKQVKPLIESEHVERVIFLGDLFDVRYSIHQQVGIEVKNMVRDMCDSFPDVMFVFIAGNHDYYSPLEEYASYNAYKLVFGDEFIGMHKNMVVVDDTPMLMEDGALILPWYYTENPNHFDEILYQYEFGRDVKAVYCHADLTVWPGGRISSLHGVPVYSGHIHYIVDDPIGNLHNLGAALPLTFGDVNQQRYLYILEDFRIIRKVPNTTTPQFKRIYNERAFDITEDDVRNSYMQICVSNSNMNKASYIERLSYIKANYTDGYVRIHIVDDGDNGEVDFSAEGFNTNINKYIAENIPQHLTNKYEMIKDKIEHPES